MLPVEGAPLVFSTAYAHDMTLSSDRQRRQDARLPVTADAAQGGFVVDTTSLGSVVLGDSVQATLRGYWGFDPYHGPTFQLSNARAAAWQLAAGDEAALIVGRQDTVHLRADSVSCVDSIMIKDPAGKELKAEWKQLKPDEVEVKLPLQEAQPGAMTLLVSAIRPRAAAADERAVLRRCRTLRRLRDSRRRCAGNPAREAGSTRSRASRSRASCSCRASCRGIRAATSCR